MTFVLCAVYVALIYVRPGEIIPGWEGFPFVEIVGVAAAISATLSVFLDPKRFPRLPVDWCFYGFIAASVLSLPANGWFGGAFVVVTALRPLLIFYVLIRIAVRTRRQLGILLVLIVLLTVFQAVNGVVQFHTGLGVGASTPIIETDAADDGEADGWESRRVRGTGIFGDPNDLAMSLVVIVPFLLGDLLTGGVGLTRRGLAAAAIVVVAYVVILTQSRGGYLGFAAACSAFVHRRFGFLWSAAVVVAMLGFLLIGATGRMRELSASEGSAQGRVQAWSAGLQMLKSEPLLGVGYGNFVENHAQVAHNSFVHVVGELGAVGGVLFIGIFYWMFSLTTGGKKSALDKNAQAVAEEIWAAGVGVAVCALFLSRQYAPTLYLPVALAGTTWAVTASGNDAKWHSTTLDWMLILVAFIAALGVMYAGVRTLAIWT